MELIKDRIDLARYFNLLGFKVGAEIGVAGGHYSEILCQEIPHLTLYCVDPWKPYRGNRRGGGEQQHNDNYSKTITKLMGYNAVLIQDFSMNAVKTFADNTLDFVYIDGNHDYSYVLEDITEWSKKVKSGGIVAGHDYYHFHNSGVIEAVNKYVSENKLNLNLTQWNNHPYKDHRCPSFWWVKP